MSASAAAPIYTRRIWSQVWRMLVGALGGLLTFIGVYAMQIPIPDATASIQEDGVFGLRLVLDICVAFVAFALYPLRHRVPLLVTSLIVLVSMISTLSAGIVILAVVSIATRRRPLEIAITSVLFITSGLVGNSLYPVDDAIPLWQLAVVAVVSTTVLALIGLYIGGRRQLIASLRRQAELTQSEQTAREQTAKADERNRIAREMHDSLAHRLSLVALHASALSHRTDLTVEQIATTAEVVRENAHLALTELREVLGVVRDHGAVRETAAGRGPDRDSASFADVAQVAVDANVRPQPTLAQLDDLVQSAISAGNPVQVTVSPDVTDRIDMLPDATGRHLYRVAQETLTNARKHATGQPVTLQLNGRLGHRLTLTIANALVRHPDRSSNTSASAVDSGFGLVGLAERLRLAGGQLEVIPNDRGRFVVRAQLPWPQ